MNNITVIPSNKLLQAVGPEKKLVVAIKLCDDIESEICVYRQEVFVDGCKGFISSNNILKDPSNANDFLNDKDNFAITCYDNNLECLFLRLVNPDRCACHVVEIRSFSSFSSEVVWMYRLWTESTTTELWKMAMVGLEDSDCAHSVNVATNDSFSDGDIMHKFLLSKYVKEAVIIN